MNSMSEVELEVALSVGLAVGIAVCLEVGFRVGKRSMQRDPESAHEGIGAIEGSVFALLGLLLAFTYAGATDRLVFRRNLIVEEANRIGVAYRRLDLLPATEQPDLHRLFREYLDERMHLSEERWEDAKARGQERARTAELQKAIWSRAVAASQKDPTPKSALLLLPALNEMIDITVTRTVAADTHVPSLILVLLISIALVSGVLSGYSMAKRKSRSRFHLVMYAAVIAITVYTVLDLEYPRGGLIHVNPADSAIIELQDMIR